MFNDYDQLLVRTSYRVPVADSLFLLVEDRLHAHLLCRAGRDIDGVLEAEAFVVVGKKMTNGGVIPADDNRVRLYLEISKIEKFFSFLIDDCQY